MSANRQNFIDQIFYPRQPVADANTPIGSRVSSVVITGLTQTRTLTLPAAANYQKDLPMSITDETGLLTSLIGIILATSGSDTINGLSALPLITTPYFSLTVASDGVSKWTVRGFGTAALGNNPNYAQSDYGPLAPALDFIFDGERSVPDGVFSRLSSGSRTAGTGFLETVYPGLLRTEHDPVSGIRRGALFEASVTNIVTTSAGVANAYAQANTALSPGASLGPFNTATLTKVTATAAGTAYAQIPYAIPTADGLTRTMSGYIRQGNTPTSYIEMQYGGGTFTTFGAAIDWTAKTITATGGACNPILTDVGNSLYRFSLTTANTVSGNNQVLFFISPRLNYSAQQAGDYVFVGDLQVEVGSKATSYIPTTGAAATRSGDSLQITGTDWFNPAQGTVFAEFWFDPIRTDVTQYPRIAAVNQVGNGFNNYYGLTLYPGTIAGLSTQKNGVGTGDIYTGVPSRNILTGLNRFAFSYGPNGVTVGMNGGTLNTTALGAVPTFTGLEIGSVSGMYQPNCLIARTSYFSRQLNDALLARMTAL